ncbi:hypothetical protein KAW38_02655 [Candidatus Micrarchaeota archaeon]|nr:hypothetical protein [Candidatus Micrarchaeota archaeon]
MIKYRLYFGLFIVLLVFSGCIQRPLEEYEYSNETIVSNLSEYPSVEDNEINIEEEEIGCAYSNPSCAENYRCLNNMCILRSGCEYNNPPCDEGYVCTNNTCFRELSSCLNEECYNEKLDFIIVTRPLFLGSLQEFIQWKKNEFGFEVGVLTLEYIAENYEGEHLAEKIKGALRNYYNKNGIKYVLLIGDTKVEPLSEPFTYAIVVEDTPEKAIKRFLDSYNLDNSWNVPTGYYLRKIEPSGSIEGKTYEYPVYFSSGLDIFYADLDEWDTNGNGFYEEDEVIKDKKGLEIYLGRWPVRTNEELLKIIEKTKNLEIVKEMLIIASSARPCRTLNLPEERWSCNCGTYYMFPSVPSDIHVTYMENTEGLSEEEIDDRKDEIPSNFDFVQYGDGTDREDILEELISKKRFVIAHSHGSYNCIFPRGPICKEDMVFKEIIPLFEVKACMVGSFFERDEDSFSEHLIKSEKGPVIVATPADSKVFYELLFDSHTVGESYYKNYDMKKTGGSGWNILLGDPSVVLYSKK